MPIVNDASLRLSSLHKRYDERDSSPCDYALLTDNQQGFLLDPGIYSFRDPPCRKFFNVSIIEVSKQNGGLIPLLSDAYYTQEYFQKKSDDQYARERLEDYRKIQCVLDISMLTKSDCLLVLKDNSRINVHFSAVFGPTTKLESHNFNSL